MVLVLVYDVVEDSRRAKLFKRMKGFLTPVQRSVFEGDLPTRRWGEMIRVVSEVIDPTEDSVRVYSLCRGCRASTLLLGVSPPVRDPSEPILI